MATNPNIKDVTENDVTPPAKETLDFNDEILTAQAEAYRNQGNEEYRKRDFITAIHFYTEGIQVNCKDEELNAKLYCNRAIAQFYLGNYHESLKDSKNATDLQPTYVKAIVRGASASVELNQFEEAITWCDKGLAKLDENNKDLLELKSRSVKALKGMQQSGKEEVKEELETKPEKGKNSLTIRSYQQGDDVTKTVQTNAVNEDEVIKSGEKALDGDEENLREKAEVYKKRGNDEYGEKNFSNAIHFYTEGIKVNCTDEELNAKLYSNRAMAHFYLGNYQDSLSDAKAATKLQPDFLEAIIRGASACVELNQFEEAITWCDKGLAIDKNSKQLLDFRITSVQVKNTLQRLEGQKAKKKSENETVKDTGEASMSASSQSEDLPYISDWFEEHFPRERIRNAASNKDTAHASLQQTTECSTPSLLLPKQSLGSNEDVIRCFNVRLSIAKKEGDKIGERDAYLILGNAFNNLANFKKAIEYHNLHLNISKEMNDKTGEGCAYGNLGNGFESLGNFKKAIEYHTLRLSIAKEVGDEAAEGRAYGNLGNAYNALGDFKQAIEYHKLRLCISQRIGDKAWEGRAYGDLGNAFQGLGDSRKAIEYHNLQLSLATDVGDKTGQERAYGNLGVAFESLGDYKKAIEYQKLSLSIAIDVGDKPGEGRAYGNLGIAFGRLGDCKKAIEYQKLAVSIAKEVGNKYEEGRAYGRLGNAFYRHGDLKKALDYTSLSLSIAKEVGDKTLEGNAYTNLGTMFDSLGELTKAIDYHNLSLRIAKHLDDRKMEGLACGNLGQAFQALGDYRKGIEYDKRYLRIAKDLGNKAGEERACSLLAHAFYSLGEFQKAIDYNKICVNIAKDAGDKVSEAGAYGNIGLALQSLGDYKEATKYFHLCLRIAKDRKDKVEERQAYRDIGSCFHSLGDCQQAISWFNKGLAKLDENNKDLLELKAMSVNALKELQKKNKKEVKEELLTKPEKGKGDDVTKPVQNSAVNENEATKSAEKALDVDEESLTDKVDVYKNKGNYEYSKKNLSNAIHFYTEGIQVNCKDDELNAKLYSNRAIAHFYLGNYQDSLSDAKAAIKLQPNFLKAIIRGASACVELNQFEEAIAWCDKGLAIVCFYTNGTLHILTANLKIDEYNKQLFDLRITSVQVRNTLQRLEGQKAKEKSENETVKDTGEATMSASSQSEDLPYILDWFEEHFPRERIRRAAANKDTMHASLQQLTECSTPSLQLPKQSLGSNEDIIDYCNLRLSIAKKEGDKIGERNAYLNLGIAFNNLADFKKAIEYHNLLLNISKEMKDKAGEGSAYGNFGNAFYSLGNFKKAIEYHALRLSIAKEVGDEAAEGRAYGNLGNAYNALGDFKQAIEYHKLRLRISKRIGDKASEGRTYGKLGNAFEGLGDSRKAIEYRNLQLSLGILHVGDKIGEERAYGNLGVAFQRLGDYKKAIEYQKLALSIAKEVGDKDAEGRAYGNIGCCFRKFYDYKRATDYFSLLLKGTGDKAAEGLAYGRLGSAFHMLGDLENALHYTTLTLSIAKEVGDKAMEGTAYTNLGTMFVGLRELTKAIDYHNSALKIAKDLGDKNMEGIAYGNLGLAFKVQGDHTKAIEHSKLCLRIAKDLGDKAGEGRAYLFLAYAFDSLGEFKNAIDYSKLCVNIAKDVGDKVLEENAYSTIGYALQSLGDYKEAIEYFHLYLHMAKDKKDKIGVGRAYGGIGNCFHNLALDESNKQLLELKTRSVNAIKEWQQKDKEEVKDELLTKPEKGKGDGVGCVVSVQTNSVDKKEGTESADEALDYDDDRLRALFKNTGDGEYVKKNFSNAVHFYTEGIKVNCKDDELKAQLYSNRAMSHLFLGNHQEARSDTIVVNAILRARAEGYKNEGNDEYMKSNFTNAVHLYTEGIQVGCQDNELDAKLYSNRATAHFYLGNYHNSLSDAMVATRLQPNFLKAIIRGASACVQLNRAEEVIKWCDKGLAVNASSQQVTGLSSEILQKPQQFRTANEAIAHFHLSLSIAKEAGNKSMEGDAYENLGNTFFRLDDIDNARCFYELQLSIAKEVGDKAAEGTAYGNLGKAFHSLGNFKEAKSFHERHLSIAKDLGDRTGEGQALGNLGFALQCLGDYNKAIDYHKLRLTISKDVGDRVGEGTACGDLGSAFCCLGNIKKALEYHDLQLHIAKDVGDQAMEGTAYNNLGNILNRLGDYKKAIDCYTKSLLIGKVLGDKASQGGAYCNLGKAYLHLGDFKKAIDCQYLSLSVAKEVGNKDLEGRAYGQLGDAFKSIGDLNKAVDYHNRSLSVAKAIGDKAGEGAAYTRIGNDFQIVCDFKQAIVYHNLALDLAKETGQKSAEGQAYGNLGNAFFGLSDFKKAIDYYNLDLSITKVVGDKAGEGSAYGNLANALKKVGDLKKAIDFNSLRLNIAKNVGNKAGEGRAYGDLGNIFSKLGDLKKAVYYHNLHLGIAKVLGDKIGKAHAYGNLGIAFHGQGDIRKAIDYHNLQLEISKEMGQKTSEGRGYWNLGAAFEALGDSEKAIEYHNLHLSIAKETGDKDAEGRAYHSLGISFESLGLLPKALEYYRSSVRLMNSVRSLLHSQDELKIGFRDESTGPYTSLFRVLLKQNRIDEALVAAEEGRAQALTELMESQYHIESSVLRTRGNEEKDTDKTGYDLLSTIFHALDRGSLNTWVLKEGPVLFRQKKLGDPRLIQVAYKEIGVGADVRCEDRSLEALGIGYCPDKNANEQTPQLLFSKNNQSSLTELYNNVIGHIADLVQGSELVIVPDGPLWLAPYAAFIDSDSKYLCESFRIRLIPSLTSLKMIEDCPDEYHCKSGALLVGDPWVTDVTDSKGEKLLEQLAFAKQEVEMIGEILKVTPLIGKEATKAEVLKRLSSVALVHIAAHGRMETGEIALTPDPKRISLIPTEDDYILTMADVLSVQLRARLVVLSCCHSGRGEIKAEGVVGIARAFMGAGARSVLVSLWAIDDEATLEFMISFYHHLVKGRSASESLNQAMKHLRESDKYSDTLVQRTDTYMIQKKTALFQRLLSELHSW
ncbi:hypothetical protein ACROYT_G010233 [Oculina patagonica]